MILSASHRRETRNNTNAVSYTHLDVYKRQALYGCYGYFALTSGGYGQHWQEVPVRYSGFGWAQTCLLYTSVLFITLQNDYCHLIRG